MYRVACFSVLFMSAAAARAQIPPPGPPFDAARHPNPIITFVENKDFRPASSEDAQKDAGIDLLGFSQSEGQREAVEMASGKYVKNMAILSVRSDVTFQPVVRQKFKLSDGADLVLHSFKFPRIGGLPRDFAQFVLHEAATEKKKKPAEMRFGGAAPEQLEIRGVPGLLFEKDGEITIYWVEEGIAHTATARLGRRELFRVVEDLL